PIAARGHGAFYQGDLVLQIGRDAEAAQIRVALGDIRIARAREVTAVDVRAAEGVADAAVATVVRVEHFRLPLGGQLGKRLRRRIGERATDPDHRLKRAAGI